MRWTSQTITPTESAWPVTLFFNIKNKSRDYLPFSDLVDVVMTAEPQKTMLTNIEGAARSFARSAGARGVSASEHAWLGHAKNVQVIFSFEDNDIVAIIYNRTCSQDSRTKAIFDTCAFVIGPTIFSTCSAVDVCTHSNIGHTCLLAGVQLCGDSDERSQSFQDSDGKEAKRQHTARLKNTEQKTPKRKKPQCFRAESQAEGKVHAPLGSDVGHVKTARAALGGCFPPMKDRTVPFNPGGTTWSLLRRPATKTFQVGQVLRGR